MAFPLYYLFRAAQARSERVRSEMVAFAFIGPAILAVQGIIAWAASRGISTDFINAGAGSAKLAQNLIDDDSTRKIASALLIPAVLGLMVAMIYIPLQSYRVGLVTRFAGTLAMALGASMFLIFPVALLAIMCWFVFVGLIFIDKIPAGSRPPAWDAGKAIPWEVGERGGRGGGLFGGPRPPSGEDEAVETSGSETTPAEPANPPRERGERRKRKRRQ